MTAIDTIMTAVAERLRAARTEARLSLDDLAARSGLSKGTLVNLERGRGNPSIAVLCQLAAALGISVADLLDHASPNLPTEFDPRAGKVVWQGPRGGWARLAAGTSGPAMVELWEWELCPGERYKASAHSKGTQEIITVRSGLLGLAVGAWSGELRAGRGMLAATDVAHAYWCVGEKAVQFRMFVSERPGA